MTTSPDQPAPPIAAPAKRPYVAPTLVTHGDVRTLTQGKFGPALDLDNGGSFPTPGTADDD